MSQTDNRLLTFEVGNEEQLVIGARDRHGRRTIYQGQEPDEYALVPTSELVDREGSAQTIDVNELRVDDLRILGPTEFVASDDDHDVELVADGEEVAKQGAPGVYGLLWIPMAKL